MAQPLSSLRLKGAIEPAFRLGRPRIRWTRFAPPSDGHFSRYLRFGLRSHSWPISLSLDAPDAFRAGHPENPPRCSTHRGPARAVVRSPRTRWSLTPIKAVDPRG
jgi:hypothetical protein